MRRETASSSWLDSDVTCSHVRICLKKFCFECAMPHSFLTIFSVGSQPRKWILQAVAASNAIPLFYGSGPNLWPAGQKWPARPQKVALDLMKNLKIYVQKLQNFHFDRVGP